MVEHSQRITNVAYYCLHKLHMRPSEFVSIPEREKAFIIAAIEIKAENDKKEKDRIRNRGGK